MHFSYPWAGHSLTSLDVYVKLPVCIQNSNKINVHQFPYLFRTTTLDKTNVIRNPKLKYEQIKTETDILCSSSHATISPFHQQIMSTQRKNQMEKSDDEENGKIATKSREREKKLQWRISVSSRKWNGDDVTRNGGDSINKAAEVQKTVKENTLVTAYWPHSLKQLVKIKLGYKAKNFSIPFSRYHPLPPPLIFYSGTISWYSHRYNHSWNGLFKVKENWVSFQRTHLSWIERNDGRKGGTMRSKVPQTCQGHECHFVCYNENVSWSVETP